MNLTLAEVKQKFERLLNNTLSREEADLWARSVIQEDARGNLVFFPESDRERIWAGVMYLYGVDLKDSPDEYLHTMDDIRAAMLEKIGT